jgi:hypothetical protein
MFNQGPLYLIYCDASRMWSALELFLRQYKDLADWIAEVTTE